MHVMYMYDGLWHKINVIYAFDYTHAYRNNCYVYCKALSSFFFILKITTTDILNYAITIDVKTYLFSDCFIINTS